MTARQLALQLLAAAGALAGANAGVSWLARSSVSRQLLRHADRADPATHVFFGNSTMAAGLDEGVFAAARPGARPLNLGLGATRPVEHLLLFRRTRPGHPGAAVYYGFLDTQLTDPPDAEWADLIGNRTVGYAVDPDAAVAFYAPAAPLRALALRVTARVPVLAERAAIWARVERVRRAAGEVGMPPARVNRFGRADDFALLESDPDEFAARCARAVADRAPLIPPVAALVREAAAAGSPVTVVEMPMPAGHRARYYARPEWAAYRARLAGLLRDAGAADVAAAAWVGDDGFADHLHLSAAGAAAFTARLARPTGGEK